MRHRDIFFLFLTFIWASAPAFSATLGDFRTKASGNWNQISTWQYYNGTTWVNAAYTPTYTDDDIDIVGGHTVIVTAPVTIDQTGVAGVLIVNAGITLTINDGSSTDLTMSGTVNIYGILVNKGSITSSSSELFFFNGGLYQHNHNGGSVPDATWYDGSTCEITGITSSTSLGGTDQSFYHFKWNCTSQTAETNLAGNLEIIRGNLYLITSGSGRMKMAETADYSLTIDGDWVHQNGTLNMGGGSSYSYITLKGNFSMLAGKITEGNSSGYLSVITFGKSGTQTFSRSGGSFENTIDFAVNSGTTLDMGESVIDGSSGNFSLNGGATLKTSHSNGIAASGASGCIQTSSRYFSSGAHFHYTRNGSQNSGSGLPTGLTGKLMIGTSNSATSLSLTNGSVTINTTLILCSSNLANSSITSGTVIYGSSATLEYQGMSQQTTTIKEWPVSSPPPHVTINNPFGVALHDNRSISGTFSLGQGQFSIGSHTLTLTGTMVRTTGTLSGGATSSMVAGGTSGSPLDIPDVTLGSLTVNRTGGIRLTGNVVITGTMIMTIGPVALLPGKALSYLAGSRLVYNGNATQNTAAEEFPATAGPPSLEISKPSGIYLNLTLSRTLSENLYLSGGIFSLGNNILTLEGMIVNGAGTLSGSSSSTLVVSGTSSLLTLPGMTLGTLTLQRPAGVTFSNDMTVTNSLILNTGTCSIGPNSLYVNGTIQYTGGTLVGGTSSTLVIGGSTPLFNLQPITLYTLQIQGTSNVNLTGNVTVEQSLILIKGGINRNGFALYGPNATLRYQGTTVQVTTDEEWPDSGGPFNVSFSNINGVSLHTDRGIGGNIELIAGPFVLGSHTLSLGGSIIEGAGNIQGGSTSNLIFTPGLQPSMLPTVFLGNLTINRTPGITINGSCTVSGTLQLDEGTLTIGPMHDLTLSGSQISGNPSNLRTWSNSVLTISGMTPDFLIPSSIGEIGTLNINNFNGVHITSDIQIFNSLFVIGKMIANELVVSGNGMVRFMPGSTIVSGHEQGIAGNIQTTGPMFIDGNVSYEFNGNRDQMTGFLPTQPAGTIQNLLINNIEPFSVLIDNPVTVRGNLQVNPGSTIVVLPSVTVEVEGEVTVW
jgi:hypothetical protein